MGASDRVNLCINSCGEGKGKFHFTALPEELELVNRGYRVLLNITDPPGFKGLLKAYVRRADVSDVHSLLPSPVLNLVYNSLSQVGSPLFLGFYLTKLYVPEGTVGEGTHINSVHEYLFIFFSELVNGETRSWFKAEVIGTMTYPYPWGHILGWKVKSIYLPQRGLTSRAPRELRVRQKIRLGKSLPAY